MSDQSDVMASRQTNGSRDSLPQAAVRSRGAGTDKDIEQNVERMIRAMVVDGDQHPIPQGQPPQTPARDRAAPRKSVPEMGERAGETTRVDNVAPDQSRATLPRAIRGFRPKRKHLLLAALGLVMILRPLLLPIVVFVTFWLGWIVYLTLGPERCAEIWGGLWARFAQRHPTRAERLHRRADAFAERFDRLLDRLPESWAERLALPDLSPPPADAPDRPDPFDRLAAQMRET